MVKKSERPCPVQLPGSIKQVHSSDHVGKNEFQGACNTPVNMTFCCQMDHGTETFLIEELLYERRINDIAFYERIIGRLIDIAQILKVPGIAELIKVKYLIIR